MPMIEMRNVSKWYGPVQVLNGCSTTVDKGAPLSLLVEPSGLDKISGSDDSSLFLWKELVFTDRLPDGGTVASPQRGLLLAPIKEAGADKDLVARINATGCDTEILSPAQTVEKIKADYLKWGRVVKEANIKAE